jgi:hypothetical protein
MPSTRDPDGINVKVFEDVDDSDKVRSDIEILDKFDALPGIQALKKAAIERCLRKPSRAPRAGAVQD